MDEQVNSTYQFSKKLLIADILVWVPTIIIIIYGIINFELLLSLPETNRLFFTIDFILGWTQIFILPVLSIILLFKTTQEIKKLKSSTLKRSLITGLKTIMGVLIIAMLVLLYAIFSLFNWYNYS